MANTLKIRRGAAIDMPALNEGEPFFTTDTHRIYIGDGAGGDYAATMLHQDSVSGAAWFLDEDNMVSDSATQVASQQSIKAYVDSSVVGLLDYQGGYDANTDTPALTSSAGAAGVKQGDTYTVTAAGTFYAGESGATSLVIGDTIIAETDDPVAAGDWTMVSKNVDDATTTTKGIVELATDGESAANVVVQGNDARLSDARTPTAHAITHESSGGDDIAGGFLGIAYTPSNYTAGDNLLKTHIGGIDTKLGELESSIASSNEFTELTDTPANYTGAGAYIVRVNAGATALEFVDFTSTYLEASPTSGETGKAPNSDWAYDHTNATTGIHGVSGNVVGTTDAQALTNKTIDCGTV